MATKTRNNKSTARPFVPTFSGNLKNLLHQAQLIDKIPGPSVTTVPEPRKTEGVTLETEGNDNIHVITSQQPVTSQADKASSQIEAEPSVPAGNGEAQTNRQNIVEVKIPATDQRPHRTKTGKEADKSKNITTPTSLRGNTLWEQIASCCEEELKISKNAGRGGTAQNVMIEKTIFRTLQSHRIKSYSVTTMVNAILRSVLLHYKTEFLRYEDKNNETMY